jgi:hypothetical protein
VPVTLARLNQSASTASTSSGVQSAKSAAKRVRYGPHTLGGGRDGDAHASAVIGVRPPDHEPAALQAIEDAVTAPVMACARPTDAG